MTDPSESGNAPELPTPEERAPFGFKNTTEFVVWLSAERLDVAVKALDAAQANLIRAAVAAERAKHFYELAKLCSQWWDERVRDRPEKNVYRAGMDKTYKWLEAWALEQHEAAIRAEPADDRSEKS